VRVIVLSHNRSDSEDAYNARLRAIRASLSAAGAEVSIAYLGDPPLGKPTVLHTCKMFRVPDIREADVLHAGSAATAFACAFLPRRRGRKLVFDMHGDTVAEAMLHARGAAPAARLRALQERVKQGIGLRAADRVVVVSNPLRAHVERLGVDAARIAVVRNGVDLDLFPPSGPVPCREEPLVAYAGRFDAWQGVANLLGLAARSGDGFRLRVIGFGDGDRALEERFRSVSGRRADLLPMQVRPALASLLAESDLLVIPREDGPVTSVAMPTKFAEYLALGRPLLVTRVGEPAALVERERCGIVTACDPGALLEGIRRYAGLSPAERRAMGERARALAEREFTWESIGRDYAAVLRDWTGEGRGA
jgi:glycosyltransferase involved in cell wall biosynthesis